MIDYEKLTMGELTTIASQGDAEAQRRLDELSPRKILLDNFPVEVDHWGRDIVFFMEGDIDAGMRLTKKWYSKKALFHPDRWQRLQPYLNERIQDGLTRFEIWNRDVVLPALALVMNDPKWGDVSLAKVHRVFRKEIRKAIEIDLLGGFTSDNKDYSSFEKEIDNKPKHEENQAIIKTIDDIVGNALENLIDLRIQLAKLNQDDRDILMFSEPGDTTWLAEKLGISENVISVRRNRLQKKLAKQLNL